VVNIHRFDDDPTVIRTEDYDISIQRVYFLDEVHRSYNPKGSFLANLSQSDQNAIKIGLTGTPLLGNDYNSRALFGEYIHKYYYNASIADGCTLRLIREEIATNYQLALRQELDAEIFKLGRRAENAQRLILYLYGTPTITVNRAMEVLGIKYVPANTLIASLVDLGVLQEATGFQRNRIFILQRYMDIFRDGN
jgi:hypothetical protein